MRRRLLTHIRDGRRGGPVLEMRAVALWEDRRRIIHDALWPRARRVRRLSVGAIGCAHRAALGQYGAPAAEFGSRRGCALRRLGCGSTHSQTMIRSTSVIQVVDERTLRRHAPTLLATQPMHLDLGTRLSPDVIRGEAVPKGFAPAERQDLGGGHLREADGKEE